MPIATFWISPHLIKYHHYNRIIEVSSPQCLIFGKALKLNPEPRAEPRPRIEPCGTTALICDHFEV